MSLLVVAALRGLTRLTAVRRHGCRAEGPLLLTAVRARAPPAAFAARHISQSAAALTTDDGRRKKFPQAVIFDLGGVVAPSPYPIFVKFEEAHGLKGGSVLDTIHQSGNGGAFAKMERGEFTVEEFCEPFAREYAAHTGTELRPEQVLDFVRELAGSFGAVEETVAVIERLREAGIKTAILTNNFRRDDGSTVLPKENVNVDVIVQSAVEGIKKPDKAIFDLTLKRLGVVAEETVFLDDIGGNLKTARNMGMHTILVDDIPEALRDLERVVERGKPSGSHVPGTSEVSPKLKFPVEPLVQYLKEKHGLHQEGPPVVRQFKHGQSNPTYFVAYGGAELVLRKKPPGKLLPSAHAVEREYRFGFVWNRVMKATQEAGVPIPELLSLCVDESIIGTPFYLMHYVPGRVPKDPALPGMEPGERGQVYREMARVLAAIHTVDVDRAGLTDFGKHGNYVSRQIGRWSKQYQASKTHEIPAMDRLMEWLPSHTPASDRTTIVHGDFRLDNLIFAPDRPEVLATLDWELSTLGDPISDLAYCCMTYHIDPGLPHLKGLGGEDLQSLGIPTEEELISHYCRLTGTPEVRDWNFYLAFTFFRVAAILQGVYKRSLQDQASADNAGAVGLMAEEFAKKGWSFAQRQQSQMGGAGGTGTTGTRAYSTLARSYSTEAPPPSIAMVTSDYASFPPRLQELRQQLLSFMAEHVLPAEGLLGGQGAEGSQRWVPRPLMEELKSTARAQGLWNLFLPLETDPEVRYGTGLTNLEYAHLAEIMGQSVFASEAFNCSAPDTGNMEVLVKYGTEEQKRQWLTPLLAGEMRSCFAMTEPNVASSDATNIQSSIVQDGNSYVLNGRKWWISGAVDPRCKICIFMGKTDPQAPKHKQQSMILVPMETPGVKVLRPLTVFNYDDAPSGHAEMEFTDVRVPAENLLLGEGRGFEIAQGRLGPGRIHHCMRLIGMAERALQLMKTRVQERVAFGKPLAEQGTILADIAHSRMEIEQARLLTLKAAHMMDTVGNKSARKEVAMIKVVAPMMAQRVVDRAMQAHGAMGLSSDRPLAQFFSWARILRLADGPDEVHTASIGKGELRGK